MACSGSCMDGFTRDFTVGLDPSIHRGDPEFLNHREMEAGKPLGCPGTAPCQEAQKAELGLHPGKAQAQRNVTIS